MKRGYSIVRSSPSGVWFGRIVEHEGTEDGLERVTMTDARRVWSWTGAGSCSGLAVHGPKDGRIAAPVDVVVSHVCERIAATPEAVKRFAAMPEWRP